VETADFASIRRATSTKLTPTEFFKLQREVYVRTAETSIICTLEEEAKHDGQLDIYAPHPYFVDVLRALVSVVADQGLNKKLPRDALRVGELARINLPGLESLPPDDIVSLRGNEEAFVSWRATLSRALDRIIQLPTDTFEREGEVTAILKGELLESSRSLERTIQSSSALQKMRGPIRSFGLGAVGALATATLSAPGPAIAAAGVAAIADLLLTFLSNKTPKGAQVLRRHFAVFEKGTS
jgi:hypothetical protein